MLIYNSLTRKKEIIKKPKNKKYIRIFVCGPTVYDYPHLGNARAFLFFDSFVKYIRSTGLKVFYLQNITDIDDKIIQRAQAEKKSWKQIARKFEKIYHQNEKDLNINSINAYGRATEHIKEIVDQVSLLLKKGYAYEIKNDGIYFDISKFKDYGKLSGRNYLMAEDATSRVDNSSNKKNKGDFALWKFSKKNEPSWKTILGEGRPGWHIEDTAIAVKFFGPQYDIHGGGIDLKFPHHEAEIAQAEGAYGKKPFVKIWIHSGHLLINGEKMSKSLKNYITISEFLKKYEPEVLRLIVLLHHYSSPINLTDELISSTQKSLANIKNFLMKINFVLDKKKKIKNAKNNIQNTQKEIKILNQKIKEALENDFNTPLALGNIFSFLGDKENKIWDMTSDEVLLIKKTILSQLKNIGLDLRIKKEKIPRKIMILVKKRDLFRKNKQFIQSDDLRKKIKSLGYIVEDTRIGTFIYQKHEP